MPRTVTSIILIAIAAFAFYAGANPDGAEKVIKKTRTIIHAIAKT